VLLRARESERLEFRDNWPLPYSAGNQPRTHSGLGSWALVEENERSAMMRTTSPTVGAVPVRLPGSPTLPSLLGDLGLAAARFVTGAASSFINREPRS